ncbi:MAG: organic solvent ABC transporter [Archangium gephyra]|uniref:Organic solvent ABC transporter n=1 Tax=Archangium gephyra TaxID=48 RepID=A0A2W5U1A1_9BACT|nr:MAG: organic solvent ABC transporter [Archangium gephyra]
MLTAAVAALALAASPGPKELVQKLDTEVQTILKSSDASTEKLSARADEFIDFVELSKRAMGAEWSKLSRQQQDQLGATMKGLLRASYAQKAIKDDRGGAANVTYGEEKIEGNDAEVKTTLAVKSDKFSVNYKLYRRDAKADWRIFDVVTDEVSLVETYKDQFKKQMAKNGFDGLISALKKKQESLEKQNAETSAKKN